MGDDLEVQAGLIIPSSELEITASRAGGAGGQHVNKTSSKVTVRWNVINSAILSAEQKTQLLRKLQVKLTSAGDLIVHASESRSQHHNRELALARLAAEIRAGLIVPKKRLRTKISRAIKEARLRFKSQRAKIKQLRKKSFED